MSSLDGSPAQSAATAAAIATATAPATAVTTTTAHPGAAVAASTTENKDGPRKRRRATVACRSCRQRKTKCDHIVPAQASDEMLRGMTKSAQVYIRSLERRVRNFEDSQRDTKRYHQQQPQQQVQQQQQSLSQSQSQSQIMTPLPSSSQQDMMMMLPPTQRPIRPLGWSTGHGQQQQQQQPQARNQLPAVLPTAPDIFLNGKAGEAFTQMILNAMNQSSARLDTQSFSSPRDSSSEVGGGGPENIYSLPHNTRDLLQVYFGFHHELTPIFHLPSITAQFEQVLSGNDAPRRPDHVYTLAIINMICAIATSHSRQGIGGFEAAARRRYDTAMRLMGPNLMSDWRIEKVQALILGTRYLQSSGYNDECWALLGLAIRIAYELDLHRPPDSEQFDCIEREVRKRVWYALFGLDKLLSMIYGRPAATSTTTFSTPLPEDLDDDCIRPNRLLFPSVQATSGMSFFLQVSKLYRLLEATTGLGDETTLADLVRLDEEFEAWQAGVPAKLQIHDSTQKPEDEKTLILALRANMVCILIHRQSVVSALSTLSSASPATRGWEGGRLQASILQRSRQICVSTAEETIRLVAGRHEQTKAATGPSWFNLYYLFTSILIIVSHVVDPDFQDDQSALVHLDQAVHMIRQMSINHLCAQRAYAFLQQLVGLLDRTLPDDRRRSLERYSTPPRLMAAGSNSRGVQGVSSTGALPTAETNMHSTSTVGMVDESVIEDGGIDLWSLWDSTQDLTMDLGSQLEQHSTLGSATWSWNTLQMQNPNGPSLL